jgi:Rieske [2Fe-2S] domain
VIFNSLLALALDDKAVILLSMASFGVATNLAGFFRTASLANLEEKQMMTVHGADRPVLLCWHEGQVFALDNRCPHMGFPLSKGSLDQGLLTYLPLASRRRWRIASQTISRTLARAYRLQFDSTIVHGAYGVVVRCNISSTASRY